MAAHGDSPVLRALLGSGKGSGAAMMMFLLGVVGCLFCLMAGQKLKTYHFSEN